MNGRVWSFATWRAPAFKEVDRSFELRVTKASAVGDSELHLA